MPSLVQRFKAWAAKSLLTDFLTGRDTDDLPPGQRLSRVYEQSTWVHAATNLVAGPISAIPLKFYDGDKEYADPKFAAWWANPALGPNRQPLSFSEAVRDLASWAKLEGEFFIAVDDTWLLSPARAGAALPKFLIMHPSRVNLIILGGELQGIEYIDCAGKRSVYLPEQVFHWKDFNPHDDWRGCGALRPAKIAAEGDYLAGVYVRDLMRNNGDQGFIVIGKSGFATQEQRDQVAAMLREKRAFLRRGVAKDVFVTGEITVDRPEAKAADAELNQTRLSSRHEVFIAFGVPPSMADIAASYSIGTASDFFRLITVTCSPLGCHIAGIFAQLASRMTGKPLTAEFDWDEHPVFQEARRERLKIASDLWQRGLSWKAINDFLDLGMKPFPGWDVAYIATTFMPVDQLSDPVTSPALAEPAPGADDPAVASLRLALLAKRRIHEQQAEARAAQRAASEIKVDPFRIFACACEGCASGVSAAFQKARNAREIQIWRDQMSLRRPTLNAYKSRFTRELMKARAEVLSKIEAAQKKQVSGAETKAGAAADFNFDLAKWDKGFQVAMRGVGKNALATAGAQCLTELGKADDVFSMPPARVLSFLDERENLLSGVGKKIYGRINDTLQAGIQDGDTMAELAQRIRDTFNAIEADRALTIATTETAAAYGVARHEAMQQAGVKYKSWLTSGNDNVRPAHADAEGQTVELGEPFTVDDEELMHPGDPNGSPGNVINCHCVEIAKSQPDED